MAKGVYRMPDGQVMVDYGRRQSPISRAQYKANGYQPTYDKLGVSGEPRPARRGRPTAQDNSSAGPTENAAPAQEH